MPPQAPLLSRLPQHSPCEHSAPARDGTKAKQRSAPTSAAMPASSVPLRAATLDLACRPSGAASSTCSATGARQLAQSNCACIRAQPLNRHADAARVAATGRTGQLAAQAGEACLRDADDWHKVGHKPCAQHLHRSSAAGGVGRRACALQAGKPSTCRGLRTCCAQSAPSMFTTKPTHASFHRLTALARSRGNVASKRPM